MSSEIYSAAYSTSELCAALAMWVRGSVKLCYGAMCGCKRKGGRREKEEDGGEKRMNMEEIG